MKRHGMSFLVCAVCLAWLAATACSSSGGGGGDAVTDTQEDGAGLDVAVDTPAPADLGPGEVGVDASTDEGDVVLVPDVGVDVPPDVPVTDVPPDVPPDLGGDVPVECTDDADCVGFFADLGACEVAGCVDNLCVKEAAPSETPCEDGNLCTEGDHCDNRNCVSGGAADCDDGQDCTTDGCDESLGCVYTANHTVCNDSELCTADSCIPFEGCVNAPRPGGCDDGDDCTVGDQCDNGECAGVARTCDDNNPCNGVETCDPASGCVAGTPPECDNGLYCDGPERCDPAFAGGCRPGIAPSCDDGDPCTAGACVEADADCVQTFDPTLEGCNATPCTEETAATDCEDEEVCTIDACVGGFCYNRSDETCSHVDCFGDIQCDDDDICTTDTCDPLNDICWNVPEDGCPDPADPCHTSEDCDDANECTDEQCVTGGRCDRFDNSGPCEDNNACTIADHCVDGACVGNDLPCEPDGDDCTLDSCDPVEGCVYPIDPECGVLPCVDDSDCDDGNPCTSGSCNQTAGYCMMQDVVGPCEDGDRCTINESCTDGVCGGGIARECDDQLPCTVDQCNPATGCFVTTDPYCTSMDCTTGFDCDDQDPCTIDTCVSFQDACFNVPRPGCGPCESEADCDDNEPCTFNVCNADSGMCEYPLDITCGADPCDTADDCDDEDSCTYDICDSQQNYCVHPAIPGCGQACTTAADCEDSDPCTENVCNEATDLCLPPIHVPDCQRCNAPQECGDGNYCTDDTCPHGACVYVPNTLACTDENACTLNDECLAGECVGETRTCDDNDPCTTNDCDPLEGCDNIRDITLPGCDACTTDADCDDDDPCTDDVCTSLTCTNQVLPYCTVKPCLDETDCADGDPCTADRCDRETSNACFNTPISPCSEPVPCTTDADCEDDSPCTVTSCGAGDVCDVVPVLPCGAACFTDNDCDDGAACTLDVCQDGACAYVADDTCTLCDPDIDDCVDDNSCTTDEVCAETGVCGFGLALEGTGCSDPCLTNPTCDARGRCVGEPLVCPDSPEPCEVAVCDPVEGCVYQPDTVDPFCNCDSDADCDDQNPCTVDHCFAGLICQNIELDSTRCESRACATSVDCDDATACTRDLCQPTADACLHLADPNCGASITCDGVEDCLDGDECTFDTCNVTCTWPDNTGIKDCAPFSACTTDADCVTGLDDCVNTPDGEVCTFIPNYCMQGFCSDDGCAYLYIPMCNPTVCTSAADCDDGNAGTTDVCPVGGGTCFNLVN